METGIVGLEAVRIDRIACWCSVDGPLLNEHPLEATPARQLTRKNILWYLDRISLGTLNLEHRILA